MEPKLTVDRKDIKKCECIKDFEEFKKGGTYEYIDANVISVKFKGVILNGFAKIFSISVFEEHFKEAYE